MSRTVEQAVAALAQANADFQNELEADCKRSDGSGAQERRRDDHRRKLEEEVYRCERALEVAKMALPFEREILGALVAPAARRMPQTG